MSTKRLTSLCLSIGAALTLAVLAVPVASAGDVTQAEWFELQRTITDGSDYPVPSPTVIWTGGEEGLAGRPGEAMAAEEGAPGMEPGMYFEHQRLFTDGYEER